MAIKQIGGGYFFTPNLYSMGWRDTYTVTLLDSANESAAFVFMVSSSGVISKIGYCTETVTTGAAVDVRLETVNTIGNPSGTLVNASSNIIQTIRDVDGSTWFTATLGSGAVVTAGTPYAINIVNPTNSAGVLNIRSRATNTVIGTDIGFPYPDNFTGSSWVKSRGEIANFYLEYTGGKSVRLANSLPTNAVSIRTFNVTSTPDEIGNAFSFEQPIEVSGLVSLCQNIVSGFDILLYDADTSTVLRRAKFDVSIYSATASNISEIAIGQFAPIVLSANTIYFSTVVPSSSANISMTSFRVASANFLNAVEGGSGMYEVNRTDSGTWVRNTTSRVMMSLLISGFDDAAQAGGAATITAAGVWGF